MAAGRAAGAWDDNLWIGMIGKRRRKGRGGVTVITFHGNTRMPRRIGIGGRPNRGGAVVTSGTGFGDIGVIEGAVRTEIEETGGVVAIAAFLRGHQVRRRFAGGDDAIMTRATAPEDFVVIHKTGEGIP